MHILKEWFTKYFTNPQVIILLLIVAILVFILMTLGQILTPVIASLVLSYLLEGLIRPLENRKVPRIFAVVIVFSLFLLALFFLVVGLIPLLSKQIGQFIQDLPRMISTWQDQLLHLPEQYPELITEQQITGLLDTINTQIAKLGQNFLSFSLASVRGIINFIIYLVLVPLMIFFFLKDKLKIISFLKNFFPPNIDLANQVWIEVNHKTAKFIQGKIWEILIIWGASYILFLFLGLRFTVLLSFLVGLSVIIPYVGATAMTIPVALVAYFQWGYGSQFAYTLISYIILQILDGNLLVPLLLSGIVKLHPLAIIIGILIFGGIWGFWGVVFAIPLATLVNAIVKAWLGLQKEQLKKERG